MSHIFDRIRSGAEQAAGKAAFEADKLRRITALQGKIRSLKSDFEKGVVQTGRLAFALYQQDQIARPDEVRRACEHLAAIQAQIMANEQKIESVRAETYVEPQSYSQYGRICPNGHGQIPAHDNFCQVCGAKAVSVPPPVSGVTCPNCGAPLAPEARFCAECGQPVTQPAPPAAPSGSCANCGATLLPDSAFCTECGHRVAAVTAALAPDVHLDVEQEDATAAAAEPAEEDVAPVELDVMESEVEGIISETPQKQELVSETKLEVDALTAAPPEAEEATVVLAKDPLAAAVEPPLAEDSGESEKQVASVVAPSPTACPVCNAPLMPDALFCAECGHRVTAKENLK